MDRLAWLTWDILDRLDSLSRGVMPTKEPLGA
jgi:hypothetical protein